MLVGGLFLAGCCLPIDWEEEAFCCCCCCCSTRVVPPPAAPPAELLLATSSESVSGLMLLPASSRSTELEVVWTLEDLCRSSWQESRKTEDRS